MPSRTRLAETTIVLTGAGGDAEVTGAELGATVDARALADAAFAAHPMWNLTDVVRRIRRAPRADRRGGRRPRRCAPPRPSCTPIPSTRRSPSTRRPRTYVATPAVPGTGVDVEAVRPALQEAFAAGETVVEVEADGRARRGATVPTCVAEATAQQLNGMLDTRRLLRRRRAHRADRPGGRGIVAHRRRPPSEGTFEITRRRRRDPAGRRRARAARESRTPRTARSITDSGGEVLREEAAGISGRELGDTSSVASDFAAQLAAGNGVFALPVTEVAPVITTARPPHRGQPQPAARLPVRERATSSTRGRSPPARRASARARATSASARKLTSQDMGNRDLTKAPYYFTARRALGDVLQRRRGPARRLLAQQLRQRDEPRLHQHARRHRPSSPTAGRRWAPRSGSTTDR